MGGSWTADRQYRTECRLALIRLADMQSTAASFFAAEVETRLPGWRQDGLISVGTAELTLSTARRHSRLLPAGVNAVAKLAERLRSLMAF